MAEQAQLSNFVSEIEGLVSQRNFTGALDAALNNPVRSKDAEVKSAAAAAVVRVLVQLKEPEFKAYIDKLSTDKLDTLLKYVYKGFTNAEAAPIMLKCHAAIFEKTGHGGIVRVLCDKKI
ncbi:MAG: hypothetical protein MHM6MM_000339 [Cercozoa sp. M6MM]